MVLPPEQPDFINFSKSSPLKIKRGKGSYENYRNNPLYPPYSKGEIYLRKEVGLAFKHLDFFRIREDGGLILSSYYQRGIDSKEAYTIL